MESLMIFRFLGMSFIFLHHINLANGIFGPFATTFFFVISGFTIGYFYLEKFKTLEFERIVTFYKKRVWRIYPLHIMTLILCGLLFMLIGHPLPNAFYTVMNIFLLQSWFPVGEYVFAYNGVSWFLSTIMFLYLVTPFLLNFISNYSKIVKLVVLAIGLYLLGILLGRFVTNLASYSLGWWFIYISPYMRVFDYLLGIILAAIFVKSKKIEMKRWVLLEILAIIVIGLSITGHLFLFNRINNDGVLRYDLYHVPAILFLIFVFVNQKGLLSRVCKNKLFSYLGDLSFSFFMIHQVIITCFMNLYSPSFMGGGNAGFDRVHFASQVFLYIIILILSDFLYRLMNKGIFISWFGKK